ncbi:MAG: peptide chain release factor N(5)-glutamine methyltransferase [Eubacterium sp.]|nr:peptide chain release factor N(5)-glutamine methyltransferase [Eubacterium sp.]
MNLKKALDFCTYYLRDKNIDEADFKSLCLVCYVAKIKNSEFYLNQSREIDANALESLLLRLENGEPLQYIIGKWDFYESEFYVGKGVLIPRPETEELVELAVSYAKKINEPVIYDLCSGSGCIGISIAKKITDSKVFCIEKSEEAFEYLKKNANGVKNVTTILADINDDIDLPMADIIVSNPPYIKSKDIKGLQRELSFEPELALDGGSDGLDFYRIISEKYTSKLKNDGVFLFEIGNEQGEDIKKLFKNADILKDIYGNDRIAEIIKE